MEGRSPKRFTGPGYYTFEAERAVPTEPVYYTKFCELDDKAPYGLVAMKDGPNELVDYWMSSQIFDDDCRT